MDTRDYLRRRVTAAVYRRLTPGELFALVRDGDGEAFAALVCRKYPHVAAVCRAVLGPGGPVEDAALDVFLELWRQRAAVRDPGRLDGWLARTARNRAAKWAAARARERRQVGPPAATDPDPHTAAARSEVLDRVGRAVRDLAAGDQAVLTAAGAADSDGEAAALLGLPVAAYRTKLHRARQRLRVVLERYGLGPVLCLLWAAGGATGRAWRVKGLAKAVVCGLAAVGVWLGSRVSPPAGEPGATPPPAAVPPESVPDRDLRVFRAEVLPRQLAALRDLAIGGGDVGAETVEAFDTRVRCVFRIRHRLGGAPWASRLELTHNAANGWTDVYLDLYGRGDWRPLDTRRPIILWRNPVTRAEVVFKVPSLEAARLAFARLPRDGRTAAAWASHVERLEQAIVPCLGLWYAHGDPARRYELRLGADRWLHIETAGPERGSRKLGSQRLDADGRLRELDLGYKQATLSADGRRLEFPRTGEWWSREPVRSP